MDSSKFKKKEIRYGSVYSRSLITRSISLPIVSIGKNIHENIEKNIASNFEGICVVEGFVQPGSTKIVTYSSGIVNGINIKFEVVFECMICIPVEGMLLQCVVQNSTKAGLKLTSATESPSPIIVFVIRDHNYSNKYFSSVEEGNKVVVKVIGIKYELNDKYISVIGELVEPRKEKSFPPKAKLVIQD